MTTQENLLLKIRGPLGTAEALLDVYPTLDSDARDTTRHRIESCLSNAARALFEYVYAGWHPTHVVELLDRLDRARAEFEKLMP